MKLYHYWRSSCSWRVRWALLHKGLTAEMIHVSLLDGESESEEHRARNPMGFVPVLDNDGRYMTESVAIIEFLDETIFDNPLFPEDPLDRAYIRALVETINAGTQPLQNLTTMEFYSDDKDKQKQWSAHFIKQGLEVYSTLMTKSGKYSFGDKVTAADLFLIPQLYNADRFGFDLDKDFPKLGAIYKEALKHPHVQGSHPDRYKPED